MEASQRVEEFRKNYQAIRDEVGQVIVGLDEAVEQVLACLLTGGHALLEGVPGIGKTMLVRTLAEVLTTGADEVKVAAAGALAAMDQAEAQRAIAALAVRAEAAEAVRIEAFRAASESVRVFGNQLTEALVEQVIEVVAGDGSLELRDAAAQLLGALNLPSEKIKSLIQAATEAD